METLPGRCGAGLQMGWVWAKEEERETWKPECAWMAGEVARGAVAPFWARRRLRRVEMHAGTRPRPGGWACKGGLTHAEEVGAHVCL